MPVYRFRVTFEEYYEVYREIDLSVRSSFYDFHKAITLSIGFPEDKSSSFYVSNDHWIKGKEIAYLPTDVKLNKGVLLMEKTLLSQLIDDPYQKFYYTYNFEKPCDFQIELVKIADEQSSIDYPYVSKVQGEAPKLYLDKTIALATAALTLDTLSDDEIEAKFFDSSELEEIDAFDVSNADLHESTEEGADNNDEDDEFSDNENFEDEGSSSYYNEDDY